MNRSEIIARLRGFVKENFLYTRPEHHLGEEDSLLKNGVIDSMGVIELIAFVEEQFGVTVGDADMTEDNFGTLGAIAAYIAQSPATSVAA